MSTTTTMVRRITRAYRQATPQDRATGLGWYAEAARVASVIDPVNPDRAAGVIAALSPRCQWSTNVVFAERVIAAADAGRPCPDVSTTDNRRTAWMIATGTAPLDALGTVSHTGRVVSGHKVRSFYANITGDTDAVTVDMWAWAVAAGQWRTYRGQRIPQDAVMTGKTYATIADAYRRAAAILGVTPRECQAAVWVAARGTKPTDAAFHAAAAA
ncbi:MAG TPA: hypothetical protein VF062_22320 [Candidatus Limnocylindrales bacterium]